jgi:MraZ protein
MLLTGNYRRNLDEKLRVSVPKQLRDALADSDLFLTPGTDRALVVYTGHVLDQIGQALGKLSPAGKDARAFSRLFYSQAQPGEIDKQGRLRIPPELAKLSGLTSEVVIVGLRDRIEIWDAEAWDSFLNSTQPSYDELAERVMEEAIRTREVGE